MIYGMTVRYFGDYDPSHIWKLWKYFGTDGAQMIEYWAPSCPVTTGRPDVLATVYRKKSSALISLAS